MPSCAATAGERDASGSAFAPRIQGRSTGSDCKCLYCPPKYCPCDSSLRTSDTGSPNTHYLCRARSPRTTGRPDKPELAVNQQSRQQEQRWQLESRESSSVSMLYAITTPSSLSVFAADVISRRQNDVSSCGSSRSCTFVCIHRVCSVTSPSGAVWRDVSHVLARRWPLVQVVLVAAQVQGAGAPASIVSAFRRVARYAEAMRAEGRPADALGSRENEPEGRRPGHSTPSTQEISIRAGSRPSAVEGRRVARARPRCRRDSTNEPS